MRELIKLSASLFIVLGVLTFLLAGFVALQAFSDGASSADATFPQIVGLVVALAGLVAGASIVLVGGTAYLLPSIDHRLEAAAASIQRANA
jgi:hypothetical protein